MYHFIDTSLKLQSAGQISKKNGSHIQSHFKWKKSHFRHSHVNLSYLPVSILKSCEDNHKRVNNVHVYTITF